MSALSPSGNLLKLATTAAAANHSPLPIDISDDDDDEQEMSGFPTEPLQGTLSKWTNYIHGWQNRFISLKDGNLVYYKSAHETDYGCRGAVSIGKAEVKPHELDELRFDVSVNDCVWYLRAFSVEDRQRWMDGIERYKAALAQLQMQQMNGAANLRRHGSAHSLSSNTFSNGSRFGGGKGRGLSEKLAEIETFRDILCRQIDTLQTYFDNCAEAAAGGHNSAVEVCKQGIDFKGEAITFKATTAGISATLSHCIELMNQKEDYWRKKFDREQVARRLAEDKYRNAVSKRIIYHHFKYVCM
jgi:collagen type IV alpha-3-binding protein